MVINELKNSVLLINKNLKMKKNNADHSMSPRYKKPQDVGENNFREAKPKQMVIRMRHI